MKDNAIKSEVYAIEIIPQKGDNRNFGKYLAQNTSFDLLVTTDDIKYAFVCKCEGFADKSRTAYETVHSIKARTVKRKLYLGETEMQTLAIQEKEKIEQEYSNSVLYCPEKLVVVNALIKHYQGFAPIKESKQDYLCSSCGAYIPFDSLNENPETAPNYCNICGQKLDWTSTLKGM